MSKKILLGIMIAALAMLAAACSNATESNMNSAANTNSNPGNTAIVTAPDNSEITTATDNGVKTETRTFRNNPRVSRVVVTTRGGTRTAKVYSPNGEEKDVAADNPDLLHATGDAIADSAGWVKDKSLTAADKTKEGAKTVADKTVDASKTVANKTVDASKKVADKTVDTSKTVYNKSKPVVKKVGNKSVDIGTTVVDKTKEGAKKTGKAIKKVIVP